MGVVIAGLIAVCSLIFWAGRAAQGGRALMDTASEVANMPRKLRYQKKAGRSGLALITDVREAAAVLMVSVARLSGAGNVTEAESALIQSQLKDNMAWPADDTEDFVDNIRWLTRDLRQPDSALRPMTKLMRGQVSAKEADDLAHMLTEIAITGSAATQRQTQFIYQYRQMMGLNAAQV